MANHQKINDKIIADFEEWYKWHPDRSVMRAFGIFWRTHYTTPAPCIETISKYIDAVDLKSKASLTMTIPYKFQATPENYRWLTKYSDVADELINKLLRAAIELSETNSNTNQTKQN